MGTTDHQRSSRLKEGITVPCRCFLLVVFFVFRSQCLAFAMLLLLSLLSAHGIWDFTQKKKAFLSSISTHALQSLFSLANDTLHLALCRHTGSSNVLFNSIKGLSNPCLCLGFVRYLPGKIITPPSEVQRRPFVGRRRRRRCWFFLALSLSIYLFFPLVVELTQI